MINVTDGQPGAVRVAPAQKVQTISAAGRIQAAQAIAAPRYRIDAAMDCPVRIDDDAPQHAAATNDPPRTFGAAFGAASGTDG